MTKMDLVSKVAEKANITKVAAEKAVNEILDAIPTALASGEKIQLVGFGTFEVKERAARKGRNPRTGEEMEIPATKLPTFKPSKFFKEMVNA